MDWSILVTKGRRLKTFFCERFAVSTHRNTLGDSKIRKEKKITLNYFFSYNNALKRTNNFKKNAMKPEINFEDFLKVDLRVGTIIEVNDFPKARKPAYQLKIDFGALGIKKSSAQITDLYTKETLLNKQVSAILNFEPRQIANFMSECLVLGIYNSSGNVVLLQASKPVKNGVQIN